MNDGLLMGMLHSLADLDEQCQALACGQPLLVAVGGNGQAGNVLHDEVGLAFGSGVGVEDLGDGRVIHDGQRLPLEVETLESGGIVTASLNQLERDTAHDGSGLFGEPDLSHTTFAEFAEETIASDGTEAGGCDGASGRGVEGYVGSVRGCVGLRFGTTPVKRRLGIAARVHVRPRYRSGMA